jgi:hypothetical protein
MADVYYPGIAAGDAAAITATGVVEAIVTPNAEYRVYELADLTFSTPLTIKTPGGSTDTKVPVGALPIFPDVYVVSPNFAHNWKSGDLVFRRDSADAKDKAVADAVAAAQASQAAAEEAAANANLPTDEAVAQSLTTVGSEPNTILNATVVKGRRADLYGNFKGLTNRPTVADSGQSWSYSWTGAPNIYMAGGLLFNNGNAGQYYMDAKGSPLPGPATSVGVEFAFFDTGTADGVVYGSWAGDGITSTGGWSGQKSRCHIILYRDKLEYYVNATGNAPAAVKTHEQKLPTQLVQHASVAAWLSRSSTASPCPPSRTPASAVTTGSRSGRRTSRTLASVRCGHRPHPRGALQRQRATLRSESRRLRGKRTRPTQLRRRRSSRSVLVTWLLVSAPQR